MKRALLVIVVCLWPCMALAQLSISPQDLGDDPVTPNVPSHKELLAALRDCNARAVPAKPWATDPKTGSPMPGAAAARTWEWGGSAEDIANCKIIEQEAQTRKSANDKLRFDAIRSSRIKALAAKLAPTPTPTP